MLFPWDGAEHQSERGAWAHASVPGGIERSEIPLLYLYSNNSTEEYAKPPTKHELEQLNALCGLLSPYHRKQAHTLFSNVARLISLSPSLGHVGFFSLTTADVPSWKEFSRRWNSFRTHFWSTSPYFGHWIGVFEQQRRGAWHLHILVIMAQEIRQGVKFEELEVRKYSSASPFLRSVWADLRAASARFGFGRSELLPIRSTSDAMARYIGKYISKHIGHREEESKGKRLVTSSRAWLKNSVRFAWNTDGAKEWRRKLEIFASMLSVNDIGDLYQRLGPGWAWKYLDFIVSIDDSLKNLKGPVTVLRNGQLVDALTGQVLF